MFEWELQRVIVGMAHEKGKLGDTTIVEEDCAGLANLEGGGKPEGETTHEEPTPKPGAKPTSEPEPSAAQPELERIPIQGTVSLPPTTNPVSSPSSEGFVAFTPTHSPRSSTPLTSRSP